MAKLYSNGSISDFIVQVLYHESASLDTDYASYDTFTHKSLIFWNISVQLTTLKQDDMIAHKSMSKNKHI